MPKPKPKFISLAKAALCTALLFCGATAQAQVPEKLPTTPAYAIGTFESLGLYLNSPDLGECKVRFRARGAATWREGLPLWFDARTNQYRGSLVYLTPGTNYDIELMPAKGKAVALSGQTRSEKFPVGKTTIVPAGENYDELKITQSGTPDAYHLVTVENGQRAAIDVANSTPSCITVDADYVIVRGLELRNAAKHGVLIVRDRHDVVVEDCHIIGWGRVGGAPAYGNEGAHDAAVLGEYNNRNLIVQRNLLEHPRGFTNDWSEGHPAGPEGVTFDHSQGGHVIRYNTIRSSEGHGFMDAIGGNSSSSHVGNINRDSDIYGNLITNVWDDGMQVEGANNNVRIWGNYIDQTTQFVATAPTGDGPMYIFRNVFGRSRWTHEVGSSGGYLIKTGGKADEDLGRRYVFHNTALGNGGGQHVFSGHTDPLAYSRNNYWDVPGMLVRNRTGEQIAQSDFDFDVFKGISGPKMKNGRGGAGFLDSNGLEFFPATWVRGRLSGRQEIVRAGKKVSLSAPPVYRRNGMIDSGERLPNFNDDFAGTGPDIGAFEQGRAPLQFGRKAGNWPLAPWE